MRKVLRELAANRGIALLIDQHLHTPDAVYVDFFRPARGDDVGAGRARAAHGRAGDPGVRAAAAPRPLPVRLRAPGGAAARRIARRRSANSRSAAPTCSRCTCGAIRSCGCGCTAAGATDEPALDERRSRSRTLTPMREAACVLVVSPNWLGDAVMALPAIADLRRCVSRGRARGRRAPVGGRSLRARARRGRGRAAGVAGPAAGVGRRFERRCSSSARSRADVGDPAAELVRLAHGSCRRAGVPERWGYATDLRRAAADTRGAPAVARACTRAAYYQHLVQRARDAAPGRCEPVVCVPPAARDDARAPVAATRMGRTASARGAGAGRGLRHGQALAAVALRARSSRSWCASAARTACSSAAPTIARPPDGFGRCWPPTWRASVIDVSRRHHARGACRAAEPRPRVRVQRLGRDAPGRGGRAPVVALFGPTREHETAPLASSGAVRSRSSRIRCGAGPACCASARSTIAA